ERCLLSLSGENRSIAATTWEARSCRHESLLTRDAIPQHLRDHQGGEVKISRRGWLRKSALIIETRPADCHESGTPAASGIPSTFRRSAGSRVAVSPGTLDPPGLLCRRPVLQGLQSARSTVLAQTVDPLLLQSHRPCAGSLLGDVTTDQ